MKFLKKILLSVLFISFFVPAVWANNNDVAAAQQRVLQVTQSIAKKLETNKVQYSKAPALLNVMIRREVLPFIDFDAMSKLTLGKYWKRATPAQRQRFVNAYREMLIRSYGKTMLKYAGASIRAGKSSANKKPGYVIVRTVVTPKGSPSIAANYDVRKRGHSWKVYNLQVGGINLITNFRTNFTREASAKGLNALIARLEKTNR